MTEREAVIAEAKSFLGTKFHHRGRVKGVGVDCIGYMLEVYERCGIIPHTDVPCYVHDFMLHSSEEIYLDGINRLAKRRPDGEPPEPGDMALFRFGKVVSHGGIMLTDRLMIHSFYGVGVCITDINSEVNLKGKSHQLRLAGFWVPNKWVIE
jgi:cell wall-associated NlpC family hydrolase